ncbi:hypothetical protein B0T24DRAFT_725188, partial [Lasiosphaeria ovina]
GKSSSASTTHREWPHSPPACSRRPRWHLCLGLHLGCRLQRPRRAKPEEELQRRLHVVQQLVVLLGPWLQHLKRKTAAISRVLRQGRFLLRFWACYVSNNSEGSFVFYCVNERFER